MNSWLINDLKKFKTLEFKIYAIDDNSAVVVSNENIKVIS